MPLSDESSALLPELRRHRLFERLGDADLAALLALAEASRPGREQVLFRQGDPCTGFFVVLDGIVRLYKCAADGREHVVEVIRKGQTFAEAAVFAGTPFPVYAEPLEASHLLFFPKAPFLHYLEERPHCLFGMIASLSVRMHQLVMKLESLTLRDAAGRLAGYLAGMEGSGGDGRLDIPRRTLAAQLGLTPETLSRTLSTLQAHGLISVDGRDFVVTDREALSALSRGESQLG
ncbi:MAG: Crp/Fnr family transcriptional regulator [Nitrospirota bacterium]|nr:Crp/Fnr family transcriptional regulator [Nitrospirota bacterium]